MSDTELERWREWARQWASWPGPPLPGHVPMTDDLLRQLIASRVQEAAAEARDGKPATATPAAPVGGSKPATAAPAAPVTAARTPEEHRARIDEDPLAYDSWHALFSHYREQDQLDAAFCLARALVFLKQANADEAQLHRQFHRPEFRQARQRLSEDMLRRQVFHPDETSGLTGVFGLVAPAAAARWAKPLPSSAKSRGRLDIAADRSPVAHMVKYVQEVLNVGPPDVYLVDHGAGVSVFNAQRDGRVHPSLFVGREAAAGDDLRPLAFALGRTMVELYLPHYTFVSVDRSLPNLKAVLRACRVMAGIDVGTPPDIEVVARELQAMLPSSYRGQIREVFERIEAAGYPLDAGQWARGVEITAYRIGLVLADDLGVAAQSIGREREGFSFLTARDMVQELVRYSISEDYFTVRKSLGLAVA
ncbi:hypothetical protein OV203_32890 [Nannocystis sp. ILAH1]|uniref:hypothetical protein n=1 Tax=Nannocystis sp. ILAH1 TaxID=2996789 RepID=UPI00226FC6B2|nr:hypothetical protein [Nannocystis sp. ILAH1]MCY0991981.1 hypothetical protein [Nannocystis sp. ILAH1]